MVYNHYNRLEWHWWWMANMGIETIPLDFGRWWFHLGDIGHWLIDVVKPNHIPMELHETGVALAIGWCKMVNLPHKMLGEWSVHFWLYHTIGLDCAKANSSARSGSIWAMNDSGLRVRTVFFGGNMSPSWNWGWNYHQLLTVILRASTLTNRCWQLRIRPGNW